MSQSHSPDEAETDPTLANGRAYAAMSAARNGNTVPDLDDETARSIGQFIQSATGDSGLGSVPSTASYPSGGIRRGMMGPGISHDGDRDIWSTLGYPDLDTVGADQYLERYERQDLARAIISIPVETTWKGYPTITDESGEETESAFEAEIAKLEDGSNLRQNLLHYFEWADRLQRIGEYGILFLGFDDGGDISQPVNESALSGPEDLTYIQPFSQASVSDWELAPPDSTERQPGLPLTYEIDFELPEAADDTTEVETRTVHYSRIVHIVEQPEQSILKHTPVLEPILNRLIDYEKVVGASAEMFWSSADRKFFAKAEGGGFSQEDVNAFDEQMWEMVNGLRTTAAGENIDLEVIDGQAVDPSGVIEAILKSIVSVVGIPMRKLLGSERGELASTMDQATWFGRIEERQQQFATPVIVRAVIQRLITYGVLPAPEGGSFEVEWPDLHDMTAEDVSKVQKNEAQAVQAVENAIALGAPRAVLYERILEWELDELTEAMPEDGAFPPAITDPTGEEPEEDEDDPGEGGEGSDEAGGQAPGTPRPDAPGEGATGGATGGATLPENTARAATDGGITVPGAPSTDDLMGWVPNAQYERGAPVSTPDGNGVVIRVATQSFAVAPVGERVTASTDDPAYVVALESGGSAPYPASALAAASWDGEATQTAGEALAPRVDDADDRALPASWTRFDLLQWYASVGASHAGAVSALQDSGAETPETTATMLVALVAGSRDHEWALPA